MSTSYLLKITLLGTKPTIWRRFVVPSEIKLDRLHDVIQAVMGWTDSHMHAFDVSGQQYLPGNFCDNGELPEEKCTLEQITPKKGDKFHYTYDFGDSWEHELVVEDTAYSNPDWPYPICCVDGAMACPPDDCGGVYGFYDFCDAMAYSKHPDHEEMKDWYGGIFIPDYWDIEEVNTAFKIKRKTPKPRGVWVKVSDDPWPPKREKTVVKKAAEKPAKKSPAKPKTTKKATKKAVKKNVKKKSK